MISLTSYHSGLLQNATPMRYLWQWRWVMKKQNIRLFVVCSSKFFPPDLLYVLYVVAFL